MLQPSSLLFLPALRTLTYRLSQSLKSNQLRPLSTQILSLQRSKPTIRFPWSQRPTQSDTACTSISVVGQIRGMKTRSSVKRLCDGCKPVRRKGRVYVICSKNPKHKQRQGK